MLETLVDYNDCNNAPFSNKNIRQAVSTIMLETEEEQCDAESNTNNMTMDNFCCQPPVTTNTQG